MTPTAPAKTSLAIGNTALDEFYRDGALETTRPGGTAFNVATWFRHYGLRSYLCSTLGADFPELRDIDTSLCERIEAESPRCQVTLNDSNAPEERRWVQGEYRHRRLGAVEDRFDVVLLTSGRAEFAPPFDTASATIKGFALDPLVGEYRAEQVAAYLDEADYLFSNQDERRVLEDTLDVAVGDLPAEYDLRAVVETSATRVCLYEPGSVRETALDSLDEPVDTTGAGDAFAATFLSEVLGDADTDAAIRSAHEAATRTITGVGAHPFRSR